MQTVGIGKVTEELKAYCMFYFDEEDLELCCSERKNRSRLLLLFCKTLILTMFIEQLHVFSVVDFSRK